jgi:hypothetical protein
VPFKSEFKRGFKCVLRSNTLSPHLVSTLCPFAVTILVRSWRLGGLSPVRGSPVMPRSGRQGRLALPCGSLYRELVLSRRAVWFGTGAANLNGKDGTWRPPPACRQTGPRRDVLHPCAASIHRGDRGLQSASEANARPEHSLAPPLATKLSRQSSACTGGTHAAPAAHGGGTAYCLLPTATAYCYCRRPAGAVAHPIPHPARPPAPRAARSRRRNPGGMPRGN